MWKSVFVFISCVGIVFSSKCSKLDITLTQKVEVGGFHGKIHWLLERNQKTLDECNVAIRLDVIQEMYVNPDQIADLNRSGELLAYIEGEVDVEEVAHLASQHIIYIYVPNAPNITVILPIHLRYQRPLIGEVFSKIAVPKPSILAICPENNCKGKTVEARCGSNVEEMCSWKNVTYEALFDEVILFLPIGDLDDYAVVSVFSLLLGCAGCIYSLSMLSGRPL